MATSRCAACGGSSFEMKEPTRIRGTDWRWAFVQCSACGTVVGVVDFWPNAQIINRLERIEKRLRI